MTDRWVPATSRFREHERRRFQPVRLAIHKHAGGLRAIPDVIDVRPGYRFRDGWITDEPAVVVVAKLPVDGAEQHDHYIYGTAKRPATQ